ncbi:MAG: hypothetical protein Q9207_004831, partial [Kuettlingeria erythrocarpa]
MAVLDELEAGILVDGQPLQEYDNDDPEEDSQPQTIVKYVKAPTGAAFAIYVRIPREYQITSEGLLYRFDADGKTMVKKYSSQEELRRGNADKRVIALGTRGRYESGACNRRPLLFTKINFEEVRSQLGSANSTSSGHTQSSATSSLDELEDLGTIKVNVFNVKNIREAPKESFGKKETSLKPIKAGKEKLDAHHITLRVTLGSAQPSDSGVGLVSDQVGDYPIASFIFKYRTEESLRQLNVIRAGVDTQEEPTGRLTLGELRAEHRTHQSGGTSASRRGSVVSQEIQQILRSPKTPENQFHHFRSLRRGSSAATTPTPTPASARFDLFREPPEPVTPKNSMSMSPPEPVSRRGSLTPTTIPSGRLSSDSHARSLMPSTPSTISTIPEESPSETTPRASGRKRTRSTSTLQAPRGSTSSDADTPMSNNSAIPTSATSSDDDDDDDAPTRRSNPKKLPKESISFWSPRPPELRRSS